MKKNIIKNKWKKCMLIAGAVFLCTLGTGCGQLPFGEQQTEETTLLDPKTRLGEGVEFWGQSFTVQDKSAEPKRYQYRLQVENEAMGSLTVRVDGEIYERYGVGDTLEIGLAGQKKEKGVGLDFAFYLDGIMVVVEEPEYSEAERKAIREKNGSGVQIQGPNGSDLILAWLTAA